MVAPRLTVAGLVLPEVRTPVRRWEVVAVVPKLTVAAPVLRVVRTPVRP